MEAQVGLESWRDRFCVDGTIPDLVEPIEHDAVKPGHSLHFLNHDVGKLTHRAHVLHTNQRRPKRVMPQVFGGDFQSWLELEDCYALVAMHDSVEGLPGRHDADCICPFRWSSRQSRPDRLD